MLLQAPVRVSRSMFLICFCHKKSAFSFGLFQDLLLMVILISLRKHRKLFQEQVSRCLLVAHHLLLLLLKLLLRLLLLCWLIVGWFRRKDFLLFGQGQLDVAWR